MRLVAATKFCCGDKDFRKSSPVDTQRFGAAKCFCNLLPSEFDSGLYSKGDLLFKSAPVSTHFCYQLLASLDVILAVQEAPATVTTVLLSAGSNYGNCLSCGLAKTSGATFSTNEK